MNWLTPAWLLAAALLLAALGVISSLIFVGLEIRQNTIAVRGATFQELTSAGSEYMRAMAHNPEAATLWIKARNRPAELTAEEQLRFFYMGRTIWHDAQNAFLQYERGLLDEELWSVQRAVICEMNEFYQDTRARHANSVTREFLAIVDSCQGADGA